MNKVETPEPTVADFLVADDLMHFLSSFGKVGDGTTTLKVEPIGEFYRVKMQFKPRVIDTLVKVKKNVF